MNKFEQHENDFPGMSEAGDMFREYKDRYSEIDELVKKYPRLAETFGRFVIMRGYKEWEVAQAITDCIGFTKNAIERQRAQEAAAAVSEEIDNS